LEVHAFDQSLVLVEETTKDTGDDAGAVTLDVRTELRHTLEAAVHHVLLADLGDGILNLHLVPVQRHRKAVEETTLRRIDQTKHGGVGGFRYQVRVARSHDGDGSRLAIACRVIDRPTGALCIEAFSEGSL